MAKIKVSVIVPVYNVEEYLAKCLDSLVKQTLEELEIIAIDDGSTDSSYQIMETYQKKYPDKVKIFSQENQGLGATRNTGIKLACGKYIGFVDSDDYVDTGMFASLYEEASRLNCDIAVSQYARVSVKGKKSVHCRLPFMVGKVYSGTDYLLHCGSIMTACNKLYRKSFIENYEFPHIWFEDVGFTPIIMSYTDRICYVAKPFYHYIRREGSIISNVGDKKTLQSIEAVKRSLANANPEKEDYVVYAMAKLLLAQAAKRSMYSNYYYACIYEFKDKISANALIKEDAALSNKLQRYLTTNQFIPKQIYYDCFGKTELREEETERISAWNEILFAFDGTVTCLDESNCDIEENDFVKKAYDGGNYELVGHYFKLKLLIENGGVALSKGLIGIKNITPLLTRSEAFFGLETGDKLCTEIYAALAKEQVLTDLMKGLLSCNPQTGSFQEVLKECLLTNQKLSYDFSMETNFKHKYLEAYQGRVRIYATSVFAYDYLIGYAFTKTVNPVSNVKTRPDGTTYREIDNFYYETLLSLYPEYLDYASTKELNQAMKPLKEEIRVLHKQRVELSEPSSFEKAQNKIRRLFD